MPIIANAKKRNEVLALLAQAYWMEIETVMNYIANSVNLDGVRAEEIKKRLACPAAPWGQVRARSPWCRPRRPSCRRDSV